MANNDKLFNLLNALLKNNPARVVKSVCRVKGTKGTGTFIKAPMAIRATKSPHITMSLILRVFFVISHLLEFISYESITD